MPEEGTPEYRRIGAASGRLTTMTATWVLCWGGGRFRAYRRLHEEGPAAPAQPILHFPSDWLMPAQRAQMPDWRAAEWLYFLESRLPLEPLTDA